MKKPDPIASQLGRRGGQATLKKHGAKKLREWGRRGGRPKKAANA